jgi:hypothetical protein
MAMCAVLLYGLQSHSGADMVANMEQMPFVKPRTFPLFFGNAGTTHYTIHCTHHPLYSPSTVLAIHCTHHPLYSPSTVLTIHCTHHPLYSPYTVLTPH